jgi:putative tryptophan/tyrosine transport system substrate-binding protein
LSWPTPIDPVGIGVVASLARPGGNITGLASSSDDSSPKQLELLAAVVPNASRIGFLGNPNSPSYSSVLKTAQSAAKRGGLSLLPIGARSPQEIEDAFVALARERVPAAMFVGDAVLYQQQHRIAELAPANRLATMFSQREYVVAGGLMSYGEDVADFCHRAPFFIDKIFKGAKPGDLPIEQPTKFNLVINLKTAKALGLTISRDFLLIADEVIE